MINFIERLLNLIYIQPCYFCKSSKEGKLLCSECYNKIKFLPPATLFMYKNCNIYSCAIYEGITKYLIWDIKYKNKKRLVRVQAKIMADYFKSLKLNKKFLVLPVPIHENRKKERKYNHMDLIGEEFAFYSDLKFNKKFLKRTKDTIKQYNLNRQERINNIKNAFELNQKIRIKKDTPILIIDDITSTGITLIEIIKLLQKNGYTDISALTFATPDIWN